MKIFLSHSTQFDYICELYDVIKSNFDSSEYSFLLPEELKVNTKEFIRNADIFFCEISPLYDNVNGTSSKYAKYCRDRRLINKYGRTWRRKRRHSFCGRIGKIWKFARAFFHKLVIKNF
jgi:hypothetical protein